MNCRSNRRPSVVRLLAVLIVMAATVVSGPSPGGAVTTGIASAAQSNNGRKAVSLTLSGPADAVTGEPFAVTLTADVDSPVVAYRVDVVATGAEIELIQPGRLAGRAVDRSVDELGDRAVLAATSCPASGCGSGAEPPGTVGVVPLGAIAVTPFAPGPIKVEAVLTELIGADGKPFRTASARDNITVAVDGSAVERPFPSVVANDAGIDPDLVNGPNAEVLSPTEQFAIDVADGCDATTEDCTSMADVQRADVRGGLGAGPQPSPGAGSPRGPRSAEATVEGLQASATGVTIVVDTTRDDGSVAPVYDTNAGDGICSTPNGDCTLRAAMQEAKAHPGHDIINFAIPGTGPHTIQLTTNLPALTDDTGTTIDGYSQPGSTPNTDPLVSNASIMIEIRGGGPTGFDAVKVRSDNNVLQGLAVYDARRPIWAFDGADGNLLVGNFIGTNAAGTFATNVLAPTAHGVHIERDSANNVIGTADPADRNVISGNARHGLGIWHAGSNNNVVQNNIVGLSPDGTVALPNAKHGLDVNFSASNTMLGGLGASEGNLVSGNGDSAVEVSHNPLDNGGQIIDMGTQVLGNRLGTGPDGELFGPETANFNTGVFVEDGVTNTVIDGNVIGNNGKGGIRIINGGSNGNTDGTVVRNNHIGVSVGGVPMANGQLGIAVESSGSTIGPANTIANSPGPAITSSELDAVGNTFTANAMTGNAGLGIELSPPGTNPNDPGDADTGPNNRLNWPEISRASDQVIEGTACADCTIEVFEVDTTPGSPLAGAVFLGSTVADSGGAFSYPSGGVTAGQSITTTATDTAGDTSEFSPAEVVAVHSDPPTVDAGPDHQIDEGSPLSLTATGSDPDLDPIVFDWDLDGDGVFESAGQTVLFDGATVDGPALVTVTARVTDEGGLVATDTADITVLNADPTGTLDVPATVDEASTFDVTVLSADDPSPIDVAAGLRFDLACPGETLPPADYATAGTSSAVTCNAPDGPASTTVAARILDNDGGILELQSTVTVANVVPTVVIAGVPASADEGDQLALSTTVTDPSPEDELAGFGLAWTIDRDGTTVATGANSTIDVDLVDSGSWQITAEATDVDGGVGVDTRVLAVNNVAPTAELTTNSVINGGQVDVTVSLINPVEPGPDDLAAGLRYAFDCLGGPLTSADYATASTASSIVCSFTSGSGSYPVSGAVIDKDDAKSTYTTNASVDNQAPDITVDPMFNVVEGGTVVATATATDPEGGAVVIEWDMDGDGIYEITGSSATFDAAAVDGPATIPISVQATDPLGLSSTAASSIVVDNAAPSLSLSPHVLDEGSTAIVDLSSATDPAPADAAALRYAVDCNGGSLASITYESASTSSTFPCPFDDGPFTGSITAAVLDDDGGSTTVSAPVTVNNLDPVGTITLPPGTAVEGDTVTIGMAATDPSPIDALSLGMSWTVESEGVVVASGTSTDATLTIGDDRPLSIELIVTDKDGATSTEQTTMPVDGAAPNGTFLAPSSVDEGGLFDLTVTDGDDVGPADQQAGLRYGFSCDGSPIAVTYADASTTPTTTCTAGGTGSLNVAGRIIDKDDLFTEFTATVNVADLPPSARFVVPRQAVVGRSVLLQALSPSEAGLLYSFDCGDGPSAFDPANTTTCAIDDVGPNPVSLTIRDGNSVEIDYPALLIGQADLGGNGSFEVDGNGDGEPDQWNLPGSGAVQVVSTAFHGAAALEQTTATASTSFIATGLLPVDRSTVLLSGMVDIVDQGTSASARIEVSWFDSSGGLLATSRTDDLTTATGGWTKIEKRVVPPNGATQAKLRAVVSTDGNAVIRLDEVLLHYDNELDNADLDLDVDGNDRPDSWWSISRFSRTNVEVHDTTFGGDLTSDGANFSIGQRVRQITAGEDYHGSIWVYVPEDASNVILRPRVRWKNSSDAVIGVDILDVLSGTSTPGWIQLSGTETAPAGAVEANFEMRIAGNLTATVYVDSAYFGRN